MVTRILFDQIDIFPDYWKMAFYARKRQYYTECWPVINCRTIGVGDKIYFIDNWRSLKSVGIFASGEIVKTEIHDQLRFQDEKYTELSPAYCSFPWNEPEEVKKKEILYVCFKLSAVIDKPEDTLKLSNLKKRNDFKGLDYQPKLTGEVFPEKYVSVLEDHWRTHVKKLALEDKAVLLPAFRKR